eukprot:TRINITY_DN4323_c0_g1_i1.p1 TRINITY_DN4323_c0_g1~~TRINITY_DN4323_c0_g1_i1.p1  ORF type:complete len:378 (-),score=87.42 TRINITY_DN4323_c0_g1_i1:30-1085(-)
MPESLGGRPPTVAEKGKEKLYSAKQSIDDETRSAKREIGAEKTLGDKAKETYRDAMPESLGGRPPTVAEKGKEKLDSAKQRIDDEARSAKYETGIDRSLGDKAKETYRETMPESLGGRSPTVAEKGKEKLDSAKQRVEDEARSAKYELGAEQTMGDKAKEMGEKAKETYRDTMPESLGGRPQTIAEKGKETLDSARYEGERKLDSAKERTDDEIRSAEEGGKSLLERGKELYKVNMPEALGGRPAAFAQQEQDKTLLQKGKEIIQSTISTIPGFLGGRPTTTTTTSDEFKDTSAMDTTHYRDTIDSTQPKDSSLTGQMQDLSIHNRPVPQAEIGRAVQQECRDRSRMPSSA